MALKHKDVYFYSRATLEKLQRINSRASPEALAASENAHPDQTHSVAPAQQPRLFLQRTPGSGLR
jgi:hypothetical protein